MAKKSAKNSSVEILIALFFIGSIFFSIPAHAGEHNWVFLGEIEGDLWFVDTDSITCKENTCKTWVKMLSRTSVKKISIENGEYTKSLIVEQGTHAELLARDGLYAHLYRTQFGAAT